MDKKVCFSDTVVMWVLGDVVCDSNIYRSIEFIYMCLGACCICTRTSDPGLDAYEVQQIGRNITNLLRFTIYTSLRVNEP